MGELSKLPNIAAKLEEQLLAAGITTAAELYETGAKDAWLKIKKTDPSACYMRLCSLEGAIQGIRWHNLPGDIKTELRDFYNKHK